MDELPKDFIREKGYSIEEKWECSWWDQFTSNVDVKNPVRTHFHSRYLFLPIHYCKTLQMKQSLAACKGFECSRETKSKTFQFLADFKISDVIRKDIKEYLNTYAEKNDKTTATNADIVLQYDQQNTYQTKFHFLLRSWTTR